MISHSIINIKLFPFIVSANQHNGKRKARKKGEEIKCAPLLQAEGINEEDKV